VAVDTQPLSSGLIVRRKGEGRGSGAPEPEEAAPVVPPPSPPELVLQTSISPVVRPEPAEQTQPQVEVLQPRRRQRGYVPPSVVERKALNVRIPLDVAEALREMANEQRITYQDLVTEMLEAGLHAWDENWKADMEIKLRNRG
jgi:hypothetical protein